MEHVQWQVRYKQAMRHFPTQWAHKCKTLHRLPILLSSGSYKTMTQGQCMMWCPSLPPSFPNCQITQLVSKTTGWEKLAWGGTVAGSLISLHKYKYKLQCLTMVHMMHLGSTGFCSNMNTVNYMKQQNILMTESLCHRMMVGCCNFPPGRS